MTQLELKRYLELGEKIKKLQEEQELLKERIKHELKDKPGRVFRYGIEYKVEERKRLNWDATLLLKRLGEEAPKFQYETMYHVVTVKPTSKALYDSL